MRCPSCASENPDSLKFCEQCAPPLNRRCARCGFENFPAVKFCGECAAPRLTRARRGCTRPCCAAFSANYCPRRTRRTGARPRIASAPRSRWHADRRRSHGSCAGATMSLSRLLRDTDCRDEARAMAEIYKVHQRLRNRRSEGAARRIEHLTVNRHPYSTARVGHVQGEYRSIIAPSRTR